MRLKQMVKDKINYRSQGPRTQLTRQTVQGRANDGGLRVGEMERDGILGHGAAHFLNESLMVRGDEYHMAVCNKSGMIAIYNPNQNLFMSPMVDGPIQFSGSLTDAGGADGAGATGASVVHMTKFGRSFSIVRIPYCLKLLMQELIVMNVQMRIITEDNIDQLPSMSYSNNVYKVIKDGRGAMGVDDIIERNRVAAGLKPRDMTAMRGQQTVEVEPETSTGSRVYLPSLSEQQENENPPRYSGLPDTSSDGTFDPDIHPEEIMMELDIDTRQNIRNLGWRFALKADIARRIRGARGTGAAAAEPLSVTGEDLLLESVILDKNGEPTEIWAISGREWMGDFPTRFPDGWLSEMLVYPDDNPISPSDMVEELRKMRKPLNWVLAIISLMERYGRRKMKSRIEAENAAMAENVRNTETNTKETERVSGEIGRAKREGNVAEEERLKVQMSRLMDERVKLDAIRREMEGDPDYVPQSPGYTSSSPIAGEEGAEEGASRVRGAVASFNAKMLDKYGDNDENIPESGGDYSPRAPSSPAYSSIFQEGGSRPRSRVPGANKFIPQIPMGVLEGYLSSRYGVAASSSSGGSGSGVMTGGGGQVGGGQVGQMSIPTMNIPVVATMPMAGMMPIQQQPQVGAATAAQGNGQAQTGGGLGAGAAPGADGVKTLSIKL
jgi:hypothetical protein